MCQCTATLFSSLFDHLHAEQGNAMEQFVQSEAKSYNNRLRAEKICLDSVKYNIKFFACIQ